VERSGRLFSVSRAAKGRSRRIEPKGLKPWRIGGLAVVCMAWSMEMRLRPQLKLYANLSNSSKIAQRNRQTFGVGISMFSPASLQIDVAEEFNDSAFENVNAVPATFGCQGFWDSPITSCKAFSRSPIEVR